MSSRTLKITNPAMRGDDVEGWEKTINAVLRGWGARFQIPVTRAYGALERTLTASILYGYGIGRSEMEQGVTPALRVKVRNKRLNAEELARFRSRADWRRRLVERLDASLDPPVHRLVAKVLTDDWGYHPPGHDGVDLMCPADAFIYAPTRCRVVDVRSGGWWGKGARPVGGHAVSEGDGIVTIEVLDEVGPLKRGYRLAYGHSEHHRVNVGQIVTAGDILGRAGFANGWHVHFMVNRGDVGTRGVGNVDPQAIVDFTQKHG